MSDFSRRKFLKITAGLGAAGALWPARSILGGTTLGRPAEKKGSSPSRDAGTVRKPVVISTWPFGIAANEAAWKILASGGGAMDAVEAGVRVPEGDPLITGVGWGGLPDEDCKVTLDASIMGPDGNAGSVAFVQNYRHPISIARKVMEETDHVMIVGAGAEEFARKQGFLREELLTEESRRKWLEWKEKMSTDDDWLPAAVNHDTIGMVALDGRGELAGACTTSGLAFKIHGRIGDSPIIGCGMYVDNEIGGAAATGKGEEVIKVCGSFQVVQFMREGLSPRDACRATLERILKRHGGKADFQVAFVALSKNGEIGACAIDKQFQYALYADGTNELFDSEHLQ